jgi:hypothetical protein
MGIIKYTIIILLLILSTTLVSAQEVWTFGPMIQVNFGGEKTNISYGIEGAYWNLSHFYYGVDGGLEYGNNRMRLYSELQTGFGLAGIAMGPVLEYNTTVSQAHMGFQYTIWANYFFGFDYRRRWVDTTTYNCIGIYLKVPFKTTGLDNSNNTTTNSTNSHHHHWDWD